MGETHTEAFVKSFADSTLAITVTFDTETGAIINTDTQVL